MNKPEWVPELQDYLDSSSCIYNIEQYTQEEFAGMHKYNDKLYLDSHYERDFDGKLPYLIYELVSWRPDGMWKSTRIPSTTIFLIGFLTQLNRKGWSKQGYSQ